MKLEEQVCNLELSSKLKELGVKQESLFYWVNVDGNQIITTEGNMYASSSAYGFKPGEIIASAFTVSELCEMLPDFVYQYKTSGQWAVWYVALEESRNPIYRNDTQANNLARMLIWLIEAGEVKV
jgi:hypothetical protein